MSKKTFRPDWGSDLGCYLLSQHRDPPAGSSPPPLPFWSDQTRCGRTSRISPWSTWWRRGWWRRGWWRSRHQWEPPALARWLILSSGSRFLPDWVANRTVLVWWWRPGGLFHRSLPGSSQPAQSDWMIARTGGRTRGRSESCWSCSPRSPHWPHWPHWPRSALRRGGRPGRDLRQSPADRRGGRMSGSRYSRSSYGRGLAGLNTQIIKNVSQTEGRDLITGQAGCRLSH